MTDAFDDADALTAPAVTDAERAAMVAGLLRADLAGDAPDAVRRAYEGAPAAERAAFLYAWNNAMDVDGLGAFIDADADRRRRAGEIAARVAPPDPGPRENEAALAAVRAFTAWDGEAAILVVPGYTPLDQRAPSPDLHPVAVRRVALVVESFHAGKALFVL